ncbi:uncharacterized protein B0I36DRAFT_353339 [Microdochium trichocladiopsis]|uniref:Uncharacterized protein n=1 Tax=Microdochium trichocladiopsis TaxID=1682393 RepID=A0A9P8Y1P4_9PEZI|nr:uncharacterized protein B0I36DRAFT_353339 [Microdochium trichocladiopsis]KAH7025192.1 hypothetical protein B0I36DRAFT_353339 [Microdochium trichocladiopsis]
MLSTLCCQTPCEVDARMFHCMLPVRKQLDIDSEYDDDNFSSVIVPDPGPSTYTNRDFCEPGPSTLPQKHRGHGKEGKGKERKGKESKGKESKGKHRKGKESKGKESKARTAKARTASAAGRLLFTSPEADLEARNLTQWYVPGFLVKDVPRQEESHRVALQRSQVHPATEAPGKGIQGPADGTCAYPDGYLVRY